MLGSIILMRLLTRPLLLAPLLPTLAVEVAPAAVATLACFQLHGDVIDPVAALLGGYGLLMVLAQLRLLPAFIRLPFTTSTWAFTFSWAAVATAALHWLQGTRPTGHAVYEWVIVSAITAFIVAITVRTLIAVARRQLLPRPVVVAGAAPKELSSSPTHKPSPAEAGSAAPAAQPGAAPSVDRSTRDTTPPPQPPPNNRFYRRLC